MKYLGAACFFLIPALAWCADGAGGANLKAGLDETCQACDDFFKHVNQKWLNANPIPGAFGRWGRFNQLAEDNRERLKNILDDMSARSASGHLAKGSPEEKVALLYGSCMDTAGIEQRGLAPIQSELAAIAAIADRDGLKRMVAAMYRLGSPSPIGLGATPDLKNSSELIAGVMGMGLTLPDRDFYFRDDPKSKRIRAELSQHMIRMNQLLGDNPEQASAAANSVMEFETRLAGAKMTNVERRDPYKRYNRMDLTGLSKLAPGFDWGALFDDSGVSRSVPVNVSEPKFIELFEKELAAASLPEWRAYLRWRLINAAAERLPERFDREAFAFEKVLTGVTEQRPRWQRCSMAVDRSIGEALGSAFVGKYFPPAAKKRMDELVNNLKLTLADELAKAEWLSAETRQQAQRKLNTIRPKIGHPDKWRDYSAVTLEKGRYLENLRAISQYQRKRDLAKIGKPVDKSEWMMTPPTVNAYYSPTWNEIVFPAGILQPPFFDVQADDAMNYGGIGAVIGHEIGHGFDDQGSKFDADGNLKNWWTEEDRKKFEARANCIVEQFNSFEVQPGARHVGKLVTGEALGDLGGLTLAYKAYQRSLKGKPAPVIDGLTGEQRFFIGFARIWAAHSRPEAERLQLQSDPHPVAKSRVNETLKNMPEFHKAFACKAGQPMVRENKCQLW